MEISLSAVSKENYEQVSDLDVHPHQQDYVASNLWSLVESHYNDNYHARAIYKGGQVVGFFMWVVASDEKVEIWRFMVDGKHQGQGIGRRAFECAISEICLQHDPGEIEICYVPENPVAKTFYESFGFKETGMDDDNEEMLAVFCRR